MPVQLTETAIKAAARRSGAEKVRVELSDAALEGLRLRLTPTGTKSWVLACRDTLGRMRRFSLGTHPALGISEARKAARTMRVEIRKGADPVADARRKRAIGQDARKGTGTLAALLDLYAEKQGRTLKTWPECRRRIDNVFASQLSRPLETIGRADLQMAADGWRSQGSAAAAVRYLRPILRWAAQRQYAAPDLTGIVPPTTVKRRQRVLSRGELAALLPLLETSESPYAGALRFMLLTLARREEVGAARWRDVDPQSAVWTIRETKNAQMHQVPLSRQATALLAAVGRGKPDDLIFASSAGTLLVNWDREAKAIMKASGTSGWTRHDLRRTGATMLGEMGELPDIVEAALNHVSIRSPLAATYNRSRYRPQVAAALQRLADALDGIRGGAANVVPLRVG